MKTMNSELVGNDFLQLSRGNTKVVTAYLDAVANTQSFYHNGAPYQVPVGKKARILGGMMESILANQVLLCTTTASAENTAAPVGVVGVKTGKNGTTRIMINNGYGKSQCALNAEIGAGLFLSFNMTVATETCVTLFLREEAV